MESFKLCIKDGGVLSGFSAIPNKTSKHHWPLIVGLHGGSYAGDYFDADEDHSVATLGRLLGFPVVSINRPEYRETTVATKRVNEETNIQRQGRYVADTLLPTLWSHFGPLTGASCIVLLTHSIGSAIGIVASSFQGSSYPLAGIIISGIGVVHGDRTVDMLSEAPSTSQPPYSLTLSAKVKDDIMLGASLGLANPDLLKQTNRLNNEMPLEEVLDISTHWPQYWKSYSGMVTVPVMYGMGEHDGLWASDEKSLHSFASGFAMSPKVDIVIVRNAPHCIELSRQSLSWLLRCSGFALECATVFATKSQQ